MEEVFLNRFGESSVSILFLDKFNPFKWFWLIMFSRMKYGIYSNLKGLFCIQISNNESRRSALEWNPYYDRIRNCTRAEKNELLKFADKVLRKTDKPENSKWLGVIAVLSVYTTCWISHLLCWLFFFQKFCLLRFFQLTFNIMLSKYGECIIVYLYVDILK